MVSIWRVHRVHGNEYTEYPLYFVIFIYFVTLHILSCIPSHISMGYMCTENERVSSQISMGFSDSLWHCTFYPLRRQCVTLCILPLRSNRIRTSFLQCRFHSNFIGNSHWKCSVEIVIGNVISLHFFSKFLVVFISSFWICAHYVSIWRCDGVTVSQTSWPHRHWMTTKRGGNGFLPPMRTRNSWFRRIAHRVWRRKTLKTAALIIWRATTTAVCGSPRDIAIWTQIRWSVMSVPLADRMRY